MLPADEPDACFLLEMDARREIHQRGRRRETPPEPFAVGRMIMPFQGGRRKQDGGLKGDIVRERIPDSAPFHHATASFPLRIPRRSATTGAEFGAGPIHPRGNSGRPGTSSSRAFPDPIPNQSILRVRNITSERLTKSPMLPRSRA